MLCTSNKLDNGQNKQCKVSLYPIEKAREWLREYVNYGCMVVL